MNNRPKTRRTMTFTADAELVDIFKEYCKQRGINQSMVLNTCMKCFSNGEISLQYFNNDLHIVEVRKND